MTALRLSVAVLVGAVAVVVGGIFLYPVGPIGDPRLAAFVASRPAFPIVFTSRSNTASFDAAAPEGEGFTFPGQRLWDASEGRLRLLRPDGSVRELTYGSIIVDVMSPSITLDGKRVLFAGRRGDAAGRWRLYEIGLDGSELRQLTGGEGDVGCDALPPMRYALDGTRMSDAERRAVDYDDVDPVEICREPRRIVFASSRAPDLGRDYARRSTTLWLIDDSGRRPLTANRNNDRWPYPLVSGYIAFSMWSRNREVITADEAGAMPGVPGVTAPSDEWMGGFIQVPGGHFGMLVKPAEPVWRPRPLFNGRIVFMTRSGIVQAEPGLIANAPSALAVGTALPTAAERGLFPGPAIAVGTPSAMPPDAVIFAGGSRSDGRIGLYVSPQEWSPATVATKVFDDPNFVDAEPVTVYPRSIPSGVASPAIDGEGVVFATSLSRTAMGDLPGQRTDAGTGPIFEGPPLGSIRTLRFYAAERDRFDDAARERVAGKWAVLREVSVKDDAASTRMPSESPSVLVGLGDDGKVVKWSTASDKNGHRATFYAYAGDHYSLTRSGGRHFCVGCHPGHSGLPRADHRHAERIP